jgi:hypothetical protein
VQVTVATTHDQPVPDSAVAVSPDGSVSTTVTVLPATTSVPAASACTVMLYCAPVCACVKLPTCVLVTVRSGGNVTMVESVAVSLLVFASPPPDTVTELTSGLLALPATFTVSVITG